MKRIALSLAALALAPFAFSSLEENLPAETFGLVKIENILKTREKLENHPLSKSAGADKLTAMFEPMLKKAKEKDARAFANFEKLRDSMKKHLTGEFVWAMVRTPNPLPEHLPFDYVVMAETGADEATIGEFLKDTKLFQPTPTEIEVPTPADNAKKNMSEESDDEEETEPVSGTVKPRLIEPRIEALEEEFAGVKLHLISTKIDDKTVGLGGWALIEKTFVCATAPNVLKDLVEARKSGRKDAFTDTAVYKSSKEAISDRDAWVLVNTSVIAEAVREHLVSARDTAKKEGKPAPGGGMFDTVKTFDAMAFDNITHLRLAVSLKPNDTRVDTSMGWKEFKGIVTLIQYKADEKPETFLAPADAISMDAARFDFGATLAALEGMIREAFPFASPMLDLQLDKMKNEEGLDIRSALLSNFGDSVVTVTGEASAGASPVDAMPQVWMVTLKDETKFASFIETVLGKIAAAQTGDGKKAIFNEREIMGVKVRDVKTGGGAAPRIAYALHKNRLLISKGDPVLLNKVIGQLSDPKAGIDATPAHLAGLAKLPAGGCAVSHADLGKLMNTVCGLVINSMNTRLADSPGVASEMKPDETKIPRAGDFPFVIVGKGYASPTGIESCAVLVPKDGDENK